MNTLIKERATLSFESLIRGIESGKIKIPHFQRKFTWKLTNAANLFDSIFKNIPIGNLVLWESEQALDYERNIGDIVIEDAEGVRSYILDGQQRSTTILASLNGLQIENKDFKKLYVDLNISPREYTFEKIVTVSSEAKALPSMFPIYKLWSENFQEHLLEVDSTRHKMNANEYANILSRTSFEIEKIITNETSIAVSIFHAINMGGIQLTVTDIMGCMLFDNERDWFFHEKTESLQTETKERGYELNKTLQLQIISYLLLRGAENKHIYSLSKNEVVEEWDNMRRAIFMAIDFLKNNYNLNQKKHLFRNHLLYLLSYFFYKNRRNPSLSQKKELEKLIIYIGVTDRYGASTNNKLPKDAIRIDSIISGQPLDEEVVMTRFGTAEEQQDILLAGKFRNLNSMKRFPLFIYSVLAMKNPLSFATGMRVLSESTQRTNQAHKHHIFPKSTYGPAADSIFNIMLLDAETNMRIGNRKPSEYILEYQENEEFKTIMESHFIGEEELLAIEQDDLESFKHSRMLKIMQFMNNYFE